MSAPVAQTFRAVFENGVLRLRGDLPFTEGEELEVLVRSRAATPTAPLSPAPSTDPVGDDDPLVRLSKLVGDGPPDGSTHIDEYKLGLKKWPR